MAAIQELRGKRIVLGVTGGIAAYKSVGLCRSLVRAETELHVLLTKTATRFVPPLPFERLTGRAAHVSSAETNRREIAELAERLDLLIVAPLTANTLSKLAVGIGGGMLLDVALATRAPLLLAPAMEPGMWRHPATCENAQRMSERGAAFVGPAEGRLASGAFGLGRMAEPSEIISRARRCLARAA